MYFNQTTERGVNKVLRVVFLLVAIGVIFVLGKFVIEHIDPDTGGITSAAAEEDDAACNETTIKAMRENGMPIPVKCKK